MRRRWLGEREFAGIVALCQFLPGPASSQTGFAIGLLRGGLAGGLAAWAGFTLPSAALLVLFAYGAPWIAGHGALHGLRRSGIWRRSLCPDRPRASIAALAAILVLLRPGPAGQIATIILGAAAGLGFCRSNDLSERLPVSLAVTVPRFVATGCLALFAGLLLLPLERDRFRLTAT